MTIAVDVTSVAIEPVTDEALAAAEEEAASLAAEEEGSKWCALVVVAFSTPGVSVTMIHPSVLVAFGLAVGLVREGKTLEVADAHHSVSVAEALVPVCVAEGTSDAEAVAFEYVLLDEASEVGLGSLVGIAEPGYEVAVTQMT